MHVSIVVAAVAVEYVATAHKSHVVAPGLYICSTEIVIILFSLQSLEESIGTSRLVEVRLARMSVRLVPKRHSFEDHQRYILVDPFR